MLTAMHKGEEVGLGLLEPPPPRKPGEKYLTAMFGTLDMGCFQSDCELSVQGKKDVYLK